MANTDIIRATLEDLRRHGVPTRELEARAIEAWNEVQGIAVVRVVSARELSESERKEFGKRLGNDDVRFVVDPTLIAGVRIEWPDRTLDQSARGMVEKLRETLAA